MTAETLEIILKLKEENVYLFQTLKDINNILKTRNLYSAYEIYKNPLVIELFGELKKVLEETSIEENNH